MEIYKITIFAASLHFAVKQLDGMKLLAYILFADVKQLDCIKLLILIEFSFLFGIYEI